MLCCLKDGLLSAAITEKTKKRGRWGVECLVLISMSKRNKEGTLLCTLLWWLLPRQWHSVKQLSTAVLKSFWQIFQHGGFQQHLTQINQYSLLVWQWWWYKAVCQQDFAQKTHHPLQLAQQACGCVSGHTKHYLGCSWRESPNFGHPACLLSLAQRHSRVLFDINYRFGTFLKYKNVNKKLLVFFFLLVIICTRHVIISIGWKYIRVLHPFTGSIPLVVFHTDV